jgi:Tfp pilus assembly protein FimT
MRVHSYRLAASCQRPHCARGRRMQGYTFIEAVAVIAIMGILLAITAPFIFRIYKRERLRSTVQEVYSQVLAARMQAVKRNGTVVVFVDLVNRNVVTWQDLAPNDYIQNPGEPTILQYHVPDFVVFSFAPNGVTDDAQAISFDRYAGNAATVDKIIFQGDGGLLQPQAANSVRPAKPGAYTAKVPNGSINCVASQCRGIYMSDRDKSFDPARNVFRISVDDFGTSGKASLLKYLPFEFGGRAGETNYVPGPWVWNE